MSSYQATEALIDAGDDLVEEIIKSQYNHSHVNSHGQSSNTQHTTTNHCSNYNSTSIESSSEDESNLESNLEDDLYDVYGKKFSKFLNPKFRSIPSSLRPNYKLLFLGIALFITGSSASTASVLDAIVYLICKQDFPSSSSSNIPSFSINSEFNDPRCFAPEISAAVGMFQSYRTTINAIFSSITIPFLSSLSDRFGRRPFFILSTSCSVLSMLITLTCTSFPNVLSYKWILFGSAIEGIGGSVLVMGILLSSYISDSIRENYRAQMLSVSEAIIYGSLAMGPVVGSAFLKLTNHSLTHLFMCSVSLEFSALILIALWLPESRPKFKTQIPAPLLSSSSETNESETASLLNSKSQDLKPWVKQQLYNLKDNLLSPLKAFRLRHIPRNQTRIRLNVYILMFVFSTIVEIGTSVVPLIFIYAKLRFKWTSVENGYFISVLAGSRFSFLALVLPFLLSWFRQHYDHSKKYIDRSDMLFLRFGLIISVAAYALLSRASNGTVFLMTACLFALSSCETPVLKNSLIKFAERGRVAELLGISQFLSRTGSIFVPPLFAWVFHRTVSFRPQLVLELVAGLYVILLISINFLYVGAPKFSGPGENEDDYENVDDN